MCGIVGYIGHDDAYPFLIKGLHRLEYRGYDSAGIALCNDNADLRYYKTKGKVAALEELTANKNISGNIGIAHTRWATHGFPNSTNAHPQLSYNEQIAIVHNGIIENYREIKEDLQEKGYTFKSETDTEVLVQFIDYVKTSQDCSLFKATQLALRNVIGAYAIALIDRREPQTLIIARKSSPLVIGVGNNYETFFCGSDASPIVEFTRNVIFLEEEDVAELTLGKSPVIQNIHGYSKEPSISRVEFDIGAIEKNGYPHFMLKEIYEQGKCLKDCMSGRIDPENAYAGLSSVIDFKRDLLYPERYVIVACGTSWHAGLIGKSIIEDLAKIPVSVEYASEFRYRKPVISPRDVVIAISQSGETADTLAALNMAKEMGAFTYSICNTVGSSITRVANTGSYIHVGPEIGVASTKAFTGQVTVLTILALTVAKEKGTIDQERFECLIRSLDKIPEMIDQIITTQSDKIKSLAKNFVASTNFIYLGRGYNYPVALEGALKLKELSYIHAEGYPAAEMKHGPIALVDENMPIVVIAPKDATHDKIISNIQELKARNGQIIGIITEGDEKLAELTDYYISIPKIEEELEPLLTVIPLQLLSYYIATEKGYDVDQPRNLAKSVTVE